MIQKIVIEIFDKAKEECSTNTKGALSKHIAEKIREEYNMPISEKTLIRCYNKYVLLREEIGTPIPENVNAFCKYLGFEDYAEYKKQNKFIAKTTKSISRIAASNSPVKLVTISSVLLLLLLFLKGYETYFTDSTACMAWEKTKYVKIPCNRDVHQKYGTTVIPMDKKLMETMRKVTLKRSDIIFSPDGKPLYWYCKVKPNKVDFFTNVGKHPINGKTLKAISKRIFEKYVPIHINNKEDFIDSTEEE